MKAISGLFFVIGISIFALNAKAATPGAAGELGLHKVDRLITLKKVMPSFAGQSVLLEVTSSASGFNVNVSQGQASDRSARMVMMNSDKDGKVLTYMEMGAKDPASPINFPAKTALTLLEYGMHCAEGEVIGDSDKCAKFANAKLYNDHFISATLTETKDSSGKVIGGEVSIKGDGLPKAMTVTLASDGSLIDVSER